jgi:hypothetical protein
MTNDLGVWTVRLYVADAVGGRSQVAHRTAIERLAHTGVVPTTASDESSYVTGIDLVVDGGTKVW